MSRLKPKGRKHPNCKTCDGLPLFDLDEPLFIHGDYYTKEELLKYKKFYDLWYGRTADDIDGIADILGSKDV